MIKLSIGTYVIDGKLTFFGETSVNSIGVIDIGGGLLRVKINCNAMIISKAQLSRIKSLGSHVDLPTLELTICDSEIVSATEMIEGLIAETSPSADWLVIWPDGRYAWSKKAMRKGGVSEMFFRSVENS